MMKTQWLNGAVKPFHKGVYQRKAMGGETLFARWDGKQWMSLCWSLISAKHARLPSLNQSGLQWRGLANPEHDRRNIGPFVSAIANANPKWSHRKVLNEAKIAVINRDARKAAGASTKGFDAKDMLTAAPSSMYLHSSVAQERGVHSFDHG